jgi:HSP20 family protein
MNNMLSFFDDFFNNAFEDEQSEDNFRAMPMDITEHDKEFSIIANLPGFKKENVNISLHDNQLVLEASCADKTEELKGTVYRCERYSGSYRRSLTLPENADVTKIIAKMEDGVLKLSIPKKEPTPLKKISIT